MDYFLSLSELGLVRVSDGEIVFSGFRRHNLIHAWYVNNSTRLPHESEFEKASLRSISFVKNHFCIYIS